MLAQDGGWTFSAAVLPYLTEVTMFQAVRDFFQKTETDPAAAKWLKQCVMTPDIWKLEQSQYQLVFIPDDMMKGRINHHLIEDAARNGEPVHPACFTLERFTMYKKDLGDLSFPIPMKKEYEPTNWLRVRPRPAKIKGQLYAILSPRIIKLDILKQNGVQFTRERQKISLPFRHVLYDEKKPLPDISRTYLRTVEAWMYIGIPKYWDDLVGDMFTVRECEKFELDQPQFWIEDYYKF